MFIGRHHFSALFRNSLTNDNIQYTLYTYTNDWHLVNTKDVNTIVKTIHMQRYNKKKLAVGEFFYTNKLYLFLFVNHFEQNFSCILFFFFFF